jgi:enolase
VSNINATIADSVRGKLFTQETLDEHLINLDGTPNKSSLGANAILAVSIAFARAVAAAENRKLFEHFAQLVNAKPKLPRLTINLFSGGKHAGGQVPIQDVLLVPMQPTIDAQLATVAAVYESAIKLTRDKYNARPLTADEGGLAPPFPSVEAMFDDAVESISRAGFSRGKDVNIAVDVAATHFSHDSMEMIETISRWLDRWPIISIEDPLAEEDWTHWPMLREKIAGRALLVGDDLLCTKPARIRRAIETKSADALLLKVNQIGTLTEAAEARKLALDANWKIIASARSGETEDSWLADLATGWAADYIKIGSIRGGERLAKYNRLLEIEEVMNAKTQRTPS